VGLESSSHVVTLIGCAYRVSGSELSWKCMLRWKWDNVCCGLVTTYNIIVGVESAESRKGLTLDFILRHGDSASSAISHPRHEGDLSEDKI